MSYALPRALVAFTAAVVLAFIVSGCSNSPSGQAEVGAIGTAGSPPPIDVQVNSMFMTVTNRAGQPLLDTRIVINAGMTPFSTTISRLESGEKRDLSLGTFTTRDGTAFSPRMARPRDIVITSVDLVGKKYETTIPWNR